MRSRSGLLGLALAGLLAFEWQPATAMPQLAASAAPSATASPALAHPIADARALVAAGRLHQAIDQLNLYIAKNPHDIRAQRFLGDLYYRANDLADAQATYLAVLSAKPGDRETYNRLGAVYAAQNKLSSAIEAYNRSLPASSSIIDLVALHRRKGDLALFIHKSERIANGNLQNAGDQTDLGQIYESVDRPADARMYFRRALALDPRDPDALNGLGLTLLDEGQNTQAAAAFKGCLRERPVSYRCTNNLAVAYLNQNRYHTARELLRAARTRRPEEPEAFVNLGYIHDAQGDWRHAVARYVQALVVGPYWRDAYLNLGLDYKAHHLYTLAESVLLKGIAAVPYDGALHVVLGQTYSALGKKQLALQQYNFAIHALDPNVRDIARSLIAGLTAAAGAGNPTH